MRVQEIRYFSIWDIDKNEIFLDCKMYFFFHSQSYQQLTSNLMLQKLHECLSNLHHHIPQPHCHKNLAMFQWLGSLQTKQFSTHHHLSLPIINLSQYLRNLPHKHFNIKHHLSLIKPHHQKVVLPLVILCQILISHPHHMPDFKILFLSINSSCSAHSALYSLGSLGIIMFKITQHTSVFRIF